MTRRTGTLVALVLSLGLVVACDSEAAEMPEGAFYLEARVSVTDDGSSGGSPREVDGGTVTELRWWYRDPEHFRHEFHQPDGVFDWGTGWSVADGDDLTYYDPLAGSYQRFSLDDSGFVGAFLPISAPIGPMPTDTVDEFIEQWSARADYVERVGTEEFLGRTVEVFEFGPTWSSSGSTSTPGGPTTEPPEESGGLGRFYVDPESNFILRYVIDGSPERQSIDAQVILLDLDPEFDGDPFEADLPSSAVELDESEDGCSSSTGSHGPGPSLSAGSISFGYIPDGWSSGGAGVSTGQGCQTLEEWSNIRRGEGELIVASARPVPPAGVPPVRAEAIPVDVAGHDGYRLTDSNIERLAWVQDDLIVTIETNAATFEELLRIAESAR